MPQFMATGEFGHYVDDGEVCDYVELGFRLSLHMYVEHSF